MKFNLYELDCVKENGFYIENNRFSLGEIQIDVDSDGSPSEDAVIETLTRTNITLGMRTAPAIPADAASLYSLEDCEYCFEVHLNMDGESVPVFCLEPCGSLS